MCILIAMLRQTLLFKHIIIFQKQHHFQTRVDRTVILHFKFINTFSKRNLSHILFLVLHHSSL